ncbi:MAG: hypothetical protein JWO94_3343 [Verrucomicrobiaceae bacterium]|nr:hypothetical protein [Verrucomicrobiaceae bacterium]
MKTTIEMPAARLAETASMALGNPLPFGSGYLRYLIAIASLDEDEPACSRMLQPVRYLAAVQPMADAARVGLESESAARNA